MRASAREIAAIAAVADKQKIPHHYPDKNQHIKHERTRNQQHPSRTDDCARRTIRPNRAIGIGAICQVEKVCKRRKGRQKIRRCDQKGASPLEKEWEDSIVASKKVKREEMRRKLKRAMLILLVFSLITTSVVYIMLLFVQENNIRITASNRNKEKSISCPWTTVFGRHTSMPKVRSICGTSVMMSATNRAT